MKKNILIVFFIITVIFGLNADDKIIKKIKDYYYKVSNEEKDPLNYGLIQTEIVMNKNNIPYAVVGDVKIIYNFLYYLKYNEEDTSDYYKLAKITISQINMNYKEFYKEYLFDENENIIFFYHKISIKDEDGRKSEERYYLNNGKIIKFINPNSGKLTKNEIEKTENNIADEVKLLKKTYNNIINMPWGYFFID